MATYSVLAVGLLLVAGFLGVRYLLIPNIDQYRDTVAAALSKAAGQTITLGGISGSWSGYQPEFQFRNVRVDDSQGQPALLLDRVDVKLSELALLSGKLKFEQLVVEKPQLHVRRDTGGTLWVAGVPIRPAEGGFTSWLLQQGETQIRGARIVWHDELRGAPELVLEQVEFRLENAANSHRFQLTGLPPQELAARLELRGEFSSRELRLGAGRFDVEVDYVDISQAVIWIGLPIEVSRGLGSLRVSTQLSGSRIVSAVADVQLVNVVVQMAATRPALELAKLQGRLGWREEPEVMELSGQGLEFELVSGARMSPISFSYTYPRGETASRRHWLELGNIDLAPMMALAGYFALDEGLRDRLARLAPSGMLEQARVSWEGSNGARQLQTAQGRFSALALRPDGVFPGIQGLKGEFNADRQAGNVSLNSGRGQLELPRVFAGPLPLDSLVAEANWSIEGDLLQVNIGKVAFANAHLAGHLSGTYSTAPAPRGTIDLKARLERADAREVWRYFPTFLSKTHAWLKRAIVAGHSRDVRLQLKGPLGEFPFADERSGLFEVAVRAEGVSIDYVAGWPPLTAGSGELIFRGDRMQLLPSKGALLGVRFSGIEASIAGLGKHDEHLLLKGRGKGPSADILRYLSVTPIAKRTGAPTETVTAIGEATLDLQLDLPLHRLEESTIAGALDVQDNQVTLDPRLPALEGFAARMAFTHKSFDLKDGKASLLGEPMSFDARNLDRDTVVANVTGRANMDSLRRYFNLPQLTRVVGQTDWRAKLRIRNQSATLKLDSSLQGVESRLPAPFFKEAGTSLPLSLEWNERPSQKSRILLRLGPLAAAQIWLDGEQNSRRATLALGQEALGNLSAPDTEGIWIKGRLEEFDIDTWRNLLVEGGAAEGWVLSRVNLAIENVDVVRRRFHNVRIDAIRKAAIWQTTLAGPDVAGNVNWETGDRPKVTALLTRLQLPRPTSEVRLGSLAQVPNNDRLPAVDLSVEDFVFEGRVLGRLTILAEREVAGWKLTRLEILNPDSKLVLDGNWLLGEKSRTEIRARLNVSNLGSFLGRIGWPDAVRGGEVTVEGPISWSGSPTHLDIPSLSGQIRLDAKKGRFEQIDPGFAKLLGILSLQALPRRITLDFRDVFSKGYSFDSIGANVNFVQGVASTENFEMDGPAAKALMRGQVNLAAETQNLNVRITPALSDSVSIASAIVNPLVGLAALITQKALKDPLGRLATFEYGISGTWSEPVVERVNSAAADKPARGR
ncbi:MAG: YhdP family protein [Burkholderiales bacterium]